MRSDVGRVLVANRGEIAVHLVRSIEELGGQAVAVYSADEADALHVRVAHDAVQLPGSGAAAYLDVGAIVRCAREQHCSGILPGYGFLSESAELARAAEEAGVVFVGPGPDALQTFGDKVAARALAEAAGVPVALGARVRDGAALEAFFREQVEVHGRGTAVMLKAAHGGGGKGMRLVREASEAADAIARCRSESMRAFGSDELFAELFIGDAKHVEIQVLADCFGNVLTLGERDCSVQRQNQKLIEIAPCPSLSGSLRRRLCRAAEDLARQGGLRGLATVEFLVQAERDAFYFMECNPRLQVEFTVTEQVWGVDLVQSLLATVLLRQPLDALALPQSPRVGGFALQLRVNAETIKRDGSCQPSAGIVDLFDPPRGTGVRVDSAAFSGCRVSPAFDALLAKIVVWGPTFEAVLRRAERALSELRVVGVRTNAGFLRSVLRHDLFTDNARLTTRFVADHAAQLVDGAEGLQLGASVLDGAGDRASSSRNILTPVSANVICSPLQGDVLEMRVREGDKVRKGDKLAVLSAFKMEHDIEATHDGIVVRALLSAGDSCAEGEALVELDAPAPGAGAATAAAAAQGLQQQAAAVDLDSYSRPELEHLAERRKWLLDGARVDKIAKKRHALGRRSARSNVEALVDSGTWVEYGDLAIAHQLGRRSLEDLVRNTPADGLIGGLGDVNGDLFGRRDGLSAVVASYDYLVLAGTQGVRGHLKKDRLFHLAAQWELPVVLFTEGGGGRPGDFTPADSSSSGLGVPAWHILANSGCGVKIGVASGYNFAGNAALLGMCDIIIATQDASIAMAGPVMVEFAGQGRTDPSLLGPAPMQHDNGVVHVLVPDEAAAVKAAKQALSYFQGRTNDWACGDQRALRALVPEDRKKSYDVRNVVRALADTGSVLEWCGAFGRSTVTAFIRVEGRPLGVLANQPLVLGGALDADGCEKAASFIELCERFRLPVLSLCDTPGFIVGADFEKTGLVKRTSRLFLQASRMTVPHFTIVLRKAYGLGAMAMSGGGFQLGGVFVVSWPTGEFGAMGLEGAVQLGFRKELAAISDPAERQATFDRLVASAYERGSAFNLANEFALDSVIDPSESRHWISRALVAASSAGHARSSRL